MRDTGPEVGRQAGRLHVPEFLLLLDVIRVSMCTVLLHPPSQG